MKSSLLVIKNISCRPVPWRNAIFRYHQLNNHFKLELKLLENINFVVVADQIKIFIHLPATFFPARFPGFFYVEALTIFLLYFLKRWIEKLMQNVS